MIPFDSRQIPLRVIHDDGYNLSSETTTLHEKLDHYFLVLGYSNTHLLSILLELLTRGKVRVAFRHYTEKTSLINPHHLMTRQEAIKLFEAYVANRRKEVEEIDEAIQVTQRVIIEHQHK